MNSQQRKLLAGYKTSWVVRNRATQQIICEIGDPVKIAWLNRPKYQSAEIYDYLSSLNDGNCSWF